MRVLSDIEASYIAGLMDGEGWITISKTLPAFYTIDCGIAMTSKDTIEFAGPAIGIGVKEYQYSDSKTLYRIGAYGRRAQEFIRQLLPYLINKKRHAELALAFPIGGSRSDDKKIMQRVIFEEIRKLNSKGRDLE